MPLDAKTSPEPGRDAGLDARGEPVVRCAACGSTVARVSDRVRVGDASLHTFVNPAGLVFRLTCYAPADGCVAMGSPSEHWTWFPGHAWRVAICRGCTVHLGWHFAGPARDFWGLIDDRLAAGDAG